MATGTEWHGQEPDDQLPPVDVRTTRQGSLDSLTDDEGDYAMNNGEGQQPASSTTPPVYGIPSPSPPACLLYTSPSPRDGLLSRMPSSA